MNKVLNNNWQTKKLGEVCEFIGGGTPSKANKNYWNGNIPWASIKDIKNQYLAQTQDSITNEGLKNSAANLAFPNDIILATRINPGRPIITKIKTAINQDLKIIKPKIEIENQFLYYLFLTIEKDILKLSNGTTVLGVTLNSLKDFEVKLPNIETQHAIVSKIEELFSELDQGIADLKTAQAQLKVYRQSVLKHAFEGKLTNKNVKEGELPEGWEVDKISSVSTINPKLPNKELISQDLEVQFLPMKLVEEIKNKIHLTEIKKFSEVQKGSYTPFIDGDIIFAKVTPCMENGKIAVVDKLKNKIGYGSSEFHVIRCSERVLNKYIFYFIVQDRFRSEAENEMTGAVGLRRVPKQFIENYFISIPPIEEQHQIVQEIESRLSVADKMEESIQESLQKAEALRQSILKKAFSGELV